MTSQSTKRLLKESTDLHKNPTPYFTASPTSDSNLHDWHFTLAGPPHPTPYAGGLYHGRITFPPTYPLRPPSFRFLTPSGRFEVNREICLSISGHHEETWQPAWGVRTALMAIRSEIMGGESRGQVGGMEGSVEVRREYARLSRGWICRECGGSSNLEVMRRVWAGCRERGVEVDSELERLAEEGESGEDREVRREAEGEGEGDRDEQSRLVSDALLETAQNASTPMSVPGPAPASGPATSDTSTTSTAPVNPVPRPTSTISTTTTTATTNTTTATPAPANSPWLDRAIIAIVMALILLILKRVSGVDEL